jgi:hypothetical protein
MANADWYGQNTRDEPANQNDRLPLSLAMRDRSRCSSEQRLTAV